WKYLLFLETNGNDHSRIVLLATRFPLHPSPPCTQNELRHCLAGPFATAHLNVCRYDSMMKICRVLLLCMLYPSIAMAQNSHAVTSPQQRQKDLEELEERAAKLPHVEVESIEKAIQISMDQGKLKLSTSLSSELIEAHVMIPNFNGISTLRWFGELNPIT